MQKIFKNIFLALALTLLYPTTSSADWYYGYTDDGVIYYKLKWNYTPSPFRRVVGFWSYYSVDIYNPYLSKLGLFWE